MNIGIRNISFDINPFEHMQFWKSIAEGKWEMETYAILDKFSNEDSVVLDIGSWAGPISMYAAAKCKKVYALEPDPAIFPQLLHNVSLNPKLQAKIECFQLAIAPTSGKQTLFARNKYGQSSSSILSRSRDLCTDEICETIRLDDFIQKQNIKEISFIKMDIEGGEFLVLPELKDSLQKINFPTLYISFHYSHLLESILKQNIRFSFLSKILLKLEKWKMYTPYKSELKKQILTCFEALSDYAYIYTTQGNLLSFDELNANPAIIKTENLVFSNIKWKAHD